MVFSATQMFLLYSYGAEFLTSVTYHILLRRARSRLVMPSMRPSCRSWLCLSQTSHASYSSTAEAERLMESRGPLEKIFKRTAKPFRRKDSEEMALSCC